MLTNRLVNGKKSILNVLSNHILYYPTPTNFSYAYSFGSLVGIIFGIQLVTGIFLAMHYTAHIDLAFSSVEHIMVDVHNGYILRYAHANGASMIFILMYIHIARGIYYRSYLHSRKTI
jgi:quinol-cytochrome oxidoreductase complex cytochrome b subunit